MLRSASVAGIAVVIVSSIVPLTALDSFDLDFLTRYVVGFDELPLGLSEGLSYAGGTVLSIRLSRNIAVVGTANPVEFEAAASSDDRVRFVLWDNPTAVRAAYTPNDPDYGNQYGPRLIGSAAAWDTTRGASDVEICIVDSGINFNHPDLEGARYLGGWDFVNNDNNPMDDLGHGTRVAGVAVASINSAAGIAGMARAGFYAVKVLDSTNSGTDLDLSDGIEWCANKGSDIINLSLGGLDPLPLTQAEVENAWASGSLLVAAAGNTPFGEPCCDPIAYPARYDEVIAVTCVQDTKFRCDFSNRGSEAELAAPGQDIYTTTITGSYDFDSGTSFSAPHVSGLAALVKSADPSLTNQQIRTRLQDTADDLGQGGRDSVYGYGLANATNSVQSAPRTASLQGTVWDQDTGLPISGVTVWTQGLEATTDANGQYEFAATSLLEGSWLVEYNHPNYETKVVTVVLGQGSNTKNVSLKSTSSGGPPGF